MLSSLLDRIRIERGLHEGGTSEAKACSILNEAMIRSSFVLIQNLRTSPRPQNFKIYPSQRFQTHLQRSFCNLISKALSNSTTFKTRKRCYIHSTIYSQELFTTNQRNKKTKEFRQATKQYIFCLFLTSGC